LILYNYIYLFRIRPMLQQSQQPMLLN